MRFGYVLASDAEAELDFQHSALKRAGCQIIISDEGCKSYVSRPGLLTIKEQITPGDIVVVWRLDRLAYSVRDLIDWMVYFDTRDIEFISLHDNIDTTTSSGGLLFKMFGVLADFERNLTRERTRNTLAAARSRGEKFGRPNALNQEKKDLAVRLYRERKTPVAKICRMIGISKPTLYSYVRAADEADSGVK